MRARSRSPARTCRRTSSTSALCSPIIAFAATQGAMSLGARASPQRSTPPAWRRIRRRSAAHARAARGYWKSSVGVLGGQRAPRLGHEPRDGREDRFAGLALADGVKEPGLEELQPAVEEVFLGREVVEHRLARDVGFACDVGDGDGVEAVLLEEAAPSERSCPRSVASCAREARADHHGGDTVLHSIEVYTQFKPGRRMVPVRGPRHAKPLRTAAPPLNDGCSETRR